MHKPVTYFDGVHTMVLIILIKVAEIGQKFRSIGQKFRYYIRRAFSWILCVLVSVLIFLPISNLTSRTSFWYHVFTIGSCTTARSRTYHNLNYKFYRCELIPVVVDQSDVDYVGSRSKVLRCEAVVHRRQIWVRFSWLETRDINTPCNAAAPNNPKHAAGIFNQLHTQGYYNAVFSRNLHFSFWNVCWTFNFLEFKT